MIAASLEDLCRAWATQACADAATVARRLDGVVARITVGQEAAGEALQDQAGRPDAPTVKSNTSIGAVTLR